METTLQNTTLTVTLSSLGAEATAIKRRDLDCAYLWNGDPTYWASHSPVLFPMVCAAMNSEIVVDGQKHAIINHGFARKTEFDLLESDDKSAVYRLLASEKSMSMYPFKFQLLIKYTLDGNNLVIDYQVDNKDEKPMYFQIGTHPGFNCPLEPDLALDDYYVEFDQPENLERHFMNAANVLIPGKSDLLGSGLKKLPMNLELFSSGALVFKQVNSSRILLKSDKSPRAVAVSFTNMNQLGIWQAKNAPFVCIEPWHGLADVDGYQGEFKDREAVIALDSGKSFNCRMVIETI